MTTGKTIALTRQAFVGKVTSLLSNMLSSLVIAFLPRSKHLNFMAAVTVHSDFGAQENKICHRFHFFPIYLPWSDGTGCHGLSFWMLSFKPAFSLSPSSGGSLVPLLFLPLKWYLLRYIQNLYLDILTSESELLKLVSILPLHIVYLSDSWNNMAIPGGLLKPTLNCPLCASEGFPLGSVVKSPLANVEDGTESDTTEAT